MHGPYFLLETPRAMTLNAPHPPRPLKSADRGAPYDHTATIAREAFLGKIWLVNCRARSMQRSRCNTPGGFIIFATEWAAVTSQALAPGATRLGGPLLWKFPELAAILRDGVSSPSLPSRTRFCMHGDARPILHAGQRMWRAGRRGFLGGRSVLLSESPPAKGDASGPGVLARWTGRGVAWRGSCGLDRACHESRLPIVALP